MRRRSIGRPKREVPLAELEVALRQAEADRAEAEASAGCLNDTCRGEAC